MFDRKIEKDLLEWKEQTGRKPLVFRGARQTGKTTLIRKLAEKFENYIELNLEKDSIKKIFSEVRNISEVIQSIEGIANQRIVPGSTLLFLDEIQNSISAIKLLRYFYEEMPHLHIVSAGSLLEVRMKTEGWSFPVGRVEFLYLFPVTFDEFLTVIGENILHERLIESRVGQSIPPPLHDRLMNLLADYMIVGGMPEAVAKYAGDKSFMSVRKCHEALASSFKEDFVKYARYSEIESLKLVWDNVPFEMGKRINYSKLSGSSVRSREVSNAFDILQEAMIIERASPTIQTAPPLIRKQKSAPKAFFLDIGLCNYMLNLTRDQIKEQLLAPFFSGALFEAFAGQELLALDVHHRSKLFFWVREEKGATSELDFLIQIENRLIPIEIKSGSHGSLKSLHQFLYRSATNLGIRVYNGTLNAENHMVTLPDGKTVRFTLLSVPIYLVFRLREIVQSLIQES